MFGDDQARKFHALAWIKIGEYSCELAMKKLKMTRATDFGELKRIIKTCYNLTLYDLKITEDTDHSLSWEIFDCYYPCYGFRLFDVKPGDWETKFWAFGTPDWLRGITKRAGFEGIYDASITAALCWGDKSCVVAVKKVAKKTGS